MNPMAIMLTSLQADRVALSTDVDFVALVTSRDPRARQQGGVIASNEHFREVLSKEELVVQELVNRFTFAME